MNAVAKNIKKLRQKYGMTQDALADKLYVTRQAVSNWETGRNQPDIDTLISISEVFGTDANELIYGVKPAPYVRFQRRYIMTASILCALIVCVSLMRVFLEPYLMRLRSMTYDPMPLLIYAAAVIPIKYLSYGALLPAALSLWIDTRVSGRTKTVFSVGGAAILFLSAAAQLIALQIFPNAPQPLMFLIVPVFRGGTAAVLYRIAVTLSGTALFLGLNK